VSAEEHVKDRGYSLARAYVIIVSYFNKSLADYENFGKLLVCCNANQFECKIKGGII
jgi:hypothetical protein